MFWLSKNVLHPFVAAMNGLTTNPAITGNPAAAQAVSDAKAQAEQLAATAGAATVAVVADAQTAANPAIAALGSGAETMADAYLTAALGPMAEAILAPGVHVVIDLGERRRWRWSARPSPRRGRSFRRRSLRLRPLLPDPALASQHRRLAPLSALGSGAAFRAKVKKF